MVRRTLFVLGVVIGGIFAFAGLVFVAMRTKSPQLLDAVRWFNRTFTNRLQRPFAGKPGAYASVIRHQGRRSGRSYETPIVPFATDDGFVVSLPYGPTADWVENVLALGSAMLIHEGRTLTLVRPEVVPVAQVEDLFPPSEQRTHRLFRIEHLGQGRSAGKPGAYASVIRHQGRRSGRSYVTPIVPFASDVGFVISLPYGPTADWVENVLALGSAVLIHEGRTLMLDRPEVVPVAQVEDLFPPSEQRTHRLFRIEHCLRLRRVEVDESAKDGDERS